LKKTFSSRFENTQLFFYILFEEEEEEEDKETF